VEAKRSIARHCDKMQKDAAETEPGEDQHLAPDFMAGRIAPPEVAAIARAAPLSDA
jgi:hypothetical protein